MGNMRPSFRLIDGSTMPRSDPKDDSQSNLKINVRNLSVQSALFDLRALICVLTAADHLSFTAAANVLNIQVSSISRKVRELENLVGVSLFERRTSGVRLTDAGRRFVSEIVPALGQLERAFERAGAAGRAETGRIRIGILTTLAGGFLRDLILNYRSCYPAILLDIHDGGRRDHLRAIKARQLDVAFITGNAPLPDCDVEEFWNERVHVALADHHPLAGRDALDWPQLNKENFIVSSMDPGPEVQDYIVRRAASYSTYPNVSSRHVTVETLMHMVAIGEGITVVSEGWTSMNCPGLALRPLIACEDIVPFSAVWSPANDNPALRRFLSFARDMAAKQPVHSDE